MSDQEMNMVHRYKDDGVVRQARILNSRPHHSRRKALVGLLVIVLCASAATAVLVNYLSSTITTDVSVTSPIELTTGDWIFSPSETSSGSEFNLHTNATNHANVDITGVADLSVQYSADDGDTWSFFDFTSGGITITYADLAGSDGGIGHLRFPATPGSILFTQSVPTPLIFHVSFATDLEPAMYRFGLIIRPTSWASGP
jgi:hypothetical protein